MSAAARRRELLSREQEAIRVIKEADAEREKIRHRLSELCRPETLDLRTIVKLFMSGALRFPDEAEEKQHPCIDHHWGVEGKVYSCGRCGEERPIPGKEEKPTPAPEDEAVELSDSAICGEQEPKAAFTCTRTPGHLGRHVARNFAHDVLARWS